MISETVLLWTGTVALLVDYVGLEKATRPDERAIAFVFSLLFWIAFTLNSLGYNHFTSTGAIRQSSQVHALIGLLGVITTLVLLLRAALGAIAGHSDT